MGQSYAVSKLRATLELPIREDEALAACRRALIDLGWLVLEGHKRTVVAREDATRLHCHCQPATASVSVAPGGSRGTVIQIATKVPGYGPISAHHAEEQSRALARRIGVFAAARRVSVDTEVS